MTTEHAEELRKLVAGQRFAMLTTVADDGSLVSRPMTIQENDDWVFRFITQESNEVTAQAEGQQVNLSIMDGGTYLSFSGTGSVDRDLQAKRELWDRLTQAYAGEPEDPENVILDVTVRTGEYWDGGNPVMRVLGLAKAAVTGDPPASGEHGAVDL